MKVLAFPKDPNPYQELLYAPMRASGVPVAYLDGPTKSHTLNLLCIPFMLFAHRLQGYRILHVHWTYQLSLPWAGGLGRLPMELLAGLYWNIAHMLGYRIVWTAHNVLPHERQFWNDARAHRYLGNTADAVIVHNDAGREQLAAIGVQTNHMQTVAHGSYVGVYPDTITRAAARKRLRIAPDKTVLLLFGMLRQYKGLEQIQKSLDALSPAERANITILVAGKSADVHTAKELKRLKRAYPGIVSLKLAFIPDADVQTYFRAADFTLLPYTQSTTSGVALLAFSFGCPVVAPDSPAFNELPDLTRIEYTGSLADGLRAAIKAPQKHRIRMAKAAAKYANDLSWPKIATRTRAIFESL